MARFFKNTTWQSGGDAGEKGRHQPWRSRCSGRAVGLVCWRGWYASLCTFVVLASTWHPIYGAAVTSCHADVAQQVSPKMVASRVVEENRKRRKTLFEDHGGVEKVRSGESVYVQISEFTHWSPDGLKWKAYGDTDARNDTMLLIFEDYDTLDAHATQENMYASSRDSYGHKQPSSWSLVKSWEFLTTTSLNADTTWIDWSVPISLQTPPYPKREATRKGMSMEELWNTVVPSSHFRLAIVLPGTGIRLLSPRFIIEPLLQVTIGKPQYEPQFLNFGAMIQMPALIDLPYSVKKRLEDLARFQGLCSKRRTEDIETSKSGHLSLTFIVTLRKLVPPSSIFQQNLFKAYDREVADALRPDHMTHRSTQVTIPLDFASPTPVPFSIPVITREINSTMNDQLFSRDSYYGSLGDTVMFEVALNTQAEILGYSRPFRLPNMAKSMDKYSIGTKSPVITPMAFSTYKPGDRIRLRWLAQSEAHHEEENIIVTLHRGCTPNLLSNPYPDIFPAPNPTSPSVDPGGHDAMFSTDEDMATVHGHYSRFDESLLQEDTYIWQVDATRQTRFWTTSLTLPPGALSGDYCLVLRRPPVRTRFRDDKGLNMAFVAMSHRFVISSISLSVAEDDITEWDCQATTTLKIRGLPSVSRKKRQSIRFDVALIRVEAAFGMTERYEWIGQAGSPLRINIVDDPFSIPVTLVAGSDDQGNDPHGIVMIHIPLDILMKDNDLPSSKGRWYLLFVIRDVLTGRWDVMGKTEVMHLPPIPRHSDVTCTNRRGNYVTCLYKSPLVDLPPDSAIPRDHWRFQLGNAAVQYLWYQMCNKRYHESLAVRCVRWSSWGDSIWWYPDENLRTDECNQDITYHNCDSESPPTRGVSRSNRASTCPDSNEIYRYIGEEQSYHYNQYIGEEQSHRNVACQISMQMDLSSDHSCNQRHSSHHPRSHSTSSYVAHSQPHSSSHSSPVPIALDLSNLQHRSSNTTPRDPLQRWHQRRTSLHSTHASHFHHDPMHAQLRRVAGDRSHGSPPNGFTDHSSAIPAASTSCPLPAYHAWRRRPTKGAAHRTFTNT